MRIFFVLLCCHFAAGAIAAREPEPEKAARPGVFLVTIDTLRADHVHCYGYDRIRTPALDLLAEQGIRFTQAFTPSPITNSSHTSIMTGLLPSSHGVSDFGVPLAAKYPTLAELLAKGGYHTAAFIGAVILDSKNLAPGLDRGFEFYDNFPEVATTKSRWGRLERRGMEVEERAESWLNTHPAGEHFVWLHFYDPHDPYEPPPPYSEIYKDRLYDGEIAYADSALGRFLAYLKKQGWYEGAMIVVVGDHGEGLGEHHEDTHGIFLYDSTTHVPLIVKLPNEREAGRTVEAQVRTTDIIPTILSLLGIAAPANLDGDSLEPLLTGVEAAPRERGDTADRATPVRRFEARDVIGVFFIDHLRPWVPFGSNKPEWTRADRLAHRFVWVGGRIPRAHDHGIRGPERHLNKGERLLKSNDKGLFVGCLHGLDIRREHLAGGVAYHPALQRRDHVAGRDRLAVMEL